MNYEQIIDAIVVRRESVTSRRVLKGEAWPVASSNGKFNSLISSLEPEQRALLAELLQSERDSGIHDALVVLSELMNLRGLRFMANGSEVEHEPYGTEMYFDWVSRINGEQWPVR